MNVAPTFDPQIDKDGNKVGTVCFFITNLV